LAEWWYNTSAHSSTRVTPFEAVYGFAPPTLLSYVPRTSANLAVDTLLQDRTTVLTLLREHLQQAQNRMKTYADRHRSTVQYRGLGLPVAPALLTEIHRCAEEPEAFPKVFWAFPNTKQNWHHGV